MRSCILLAIMLVGGVRGEADSTATESKTSIVVEDKAPGKRAPTHLTAVPGEQVQVGGGQPLPYKYYEAAKVVGGPRPAPYTPQYAYMLAQQQLAPVPTPVTPMTIFIMAPHPAGYMMLIPASVNPYAMLQYLSPHHGPAAAAATPTPYYQPYYTPKIYSTVSPVYPGKTQYLSQNAGFAAHHQLLYPGPYQPSPTLQTLQSVQTVLSAAPHQPQSRPQEPEPAPSEPAKSYSSIRSRSLSSSLSS